MKMFTVSALVCAMMLLTGAAGSHLIKRTYSTGWFQFGGHWFYFVPQAMTWTKAEKYCQSLGGNLASTHSLHEHQQIQKVTVSETWLGGSDAQEEGQWFWSDGSTFNYNNWCSGEPSNHGGSQHCLQIVHRGTEKCWDDFACSGKRPFLCAITSCRNMG